MSAEVNFQVYNVFLRRVYDPSFHHFLQLIQTPPFQRRYGHHVRVRKLIAEMKQTKRQAGSHSPSTLRKVTKVMPPVIIHNIKHPVMITDSNVSYGFGYS